MSRLFTTKIKLEAYPKEFSSVEARNASIIPTLYNMATGDMGMDISYEQIHIASVDTVDHEADPLELYVHWRVNPKKE